MGSSSGVYLKFADIRDAEKAISWVTSLSRNWNAHYISPTDFAAITEPEKPVSAYEGQVLMTATFIRPPKNIDVDATGKFISELIGDYGNVMAFEVRPGKSLDVSYHMEFCDIRAIEKALIDLNELKFDVGRCPILPDTCRKLIAQRILF